MIPKALKQRKANAATFIQKYLRGYLVFHNHFIEIRKSKLKENEKFFEEMRNQIQLDALRIIVPWWK